MGDTAGKQPSSRPRGKGRCRPQGKENLMRRAKRQCHGDGNVKVLEQSTGCLNAMDLQHQPMLDIVKPWADLWEDLEAEGWRIVRGPRGDAYYMPPGVERGVGAKVRVDYFDSQMQVVRYLQARAAECPRTRVRQHSMSGR